MDKINLFFPLPMLKANSHISSFGLHSFTSRPQPCLPGSRLTTTDCLYRILTWGLFHTRMTHGASYLPATTCTFLLVPSAFLVRVQALYSSFRTCYEITPSVQSPSTPQDRINHSSYYHAFLWLSQSLPLFSLLLSFQFSLVPKACQYILTRL